MESFFILLLFLFFNFCFFIFVIFFSSGESSTPVCNSISSHNLLLARNLFSARDRDVSILTSICVGMCLRYTPVEEWAVFCPPGPREVMNFSSKSSSLIFSFFIRSSSSASFLGDTPNFPIIVYLFLYLYLFLHVFLLAYFSVAIIICLFYYCNGVFQLGLGMSIKGRELSPLGGSFPKK